MTKFIRNLIFFCGAFALFALSPQYAFASGIGLQDFRGDVTITKSTFSNNFTGIQLTTTNSASIANNTIGNLHIDGNIIEDSQWHGIKIDLSNTGTITIENNILDNSNATSNGRFGIRIQNHPSPSIANNTVRNFGRSGIQLRSISNITVTNNVLFSNGRQNYSVVNSDTTFYASGIQAIDSTFSNVSYNTITSNLHAGIAAYGSIGVIGPYNTIMYDGFPGLPGGAGGSMEDCAPVASGEGSYRGGILVRDLAETEEMTIMCTNTISDNYYGNVVKGGDGTVTSCGNAINAFFVDASASVFFFGDDSGHVELDCLDPGPIFSDRVVNGTIDVVNESPNPQDPLAFGILITGSSSDVTVKNCTIKNAATELQYAEEAGDGTLIGAGIFIANGANPYIHSNYIFSNGWAILDDRIYTEAGSSGVQMRCAGSQTSIVNNIIASNKNDGIVGRETGGLIGLANMGNTFRNNGRGGIGIFDGMPSRNLEIAYNTIYNNSRGIGAIDFDGDMFTIANNIIYNNQATSSASGSAISFSDMVSTGNAVIVGNKIYSNIDLSTGGVGGIKSKNAFGTISLANNYIAGNMGPIGGIGITALNGTVSFVNNQIMNNIGSSSDVGLMNVGGIGFNAATASAEIYLDGNTLKNNIARVTGGPNRGRVGGLGLSLSNATVSLLNNSIGNNNAICIGGVGFDLFGGNAYIASNYIYSNTNNKSDWGAGGLSFDEAFGTITVSANTIFNNANQATGSGGVALNALQASASILIDGNMIYSNTGDRAGGIGIMQAGSGNITISNNNVYSNTGYAGIGVAGSPQLTVENNTVKNNDGVGISFGDGTTPFSGLALIDSNTINNNDGNQTGQYGAGAIGGRGLSAANITITNNYIYSHLGIPGNEKAGVSFSMANFATPLVLSNNTMASNNAGSVGFASCTGDINIYSNTLLDGLAFIDNTAGDINISSNNIIGKGVKTNLVTDAELHATILANDNDRISIINNTIDANKEGWNGVMTVCKDTQNGFEVSGNTFINALKNGFSSGFVHIDVANGRSTGRIHGNVFRQNRWRGIAMFNPVSVSIYNNTIFSNGQGNGGRVPSCNACHRFPDQSPPSADMSGSSAPDSGIAIGRENRNIAMSVFVYSNRIYSNNGSAINVGALESNSSASIYNNIIGSSYVGNSMMGIGVSHASCDLDITNNKIINNGDTAIGLDYFFGSGLIDGNTINNNTAATTAAGIGVSLSDTSDLTIKNNLINNNVGSVGGIGIIDSDGSYYIGENNIIFSNSGFGIGVNNVDSVNIYSSSISFHDRSGINFSLTNQITLKNNTILSNGTAQSYLLDVNEERDASGVRAKDSVFGSVEGNTIKNHLYTAISAFRTDGNIGPNNTFQNNGSGEDQISACSSLTVYGEGDGAVSVRGLVMGDTLIVTDNYIIDNVVGSVRCKDGEGVVRLNGNSVQCGLWDKYDTGVFVSNDLDIFVNGTSVTNGSIVDCQDPLIPDTISNAGVWGVAILAGTNTVTVKNCTIENNMTVGNTKGPGGNSLGGGLLIGPDTHAYVHDNIIRSNGFELAPNGQGGNVGLAMRCSGSDTKIWSNYIYSNKSDGINATEIPCNIGGDSPASRNYIYNNGRSGITVKDINASVSIAYNDIYSNVKTGVAVKNCSNITLESLTIYSNGNGVVAVRPTSDIDPGTPPDAGVSLNGCDATTLKNLVVRNNDGFGISLTDMLSNEDVTITSSLIGGYNQGNSRSGIGVGVFGWGMETNLGVINIDDHVYSNRIIDNRDIGIGFFNYGGEVNIVGNLISSNEGDGVAHTWAPGAIGLFEPVAPRVNIERNRILNNYSAGVIGRANSRVAVIAAQMNSSGTGLLIDNVDSGCSSSGVWNESATGCYYGTDVLSHDVDGSGDSVTWTPTIPARKQYNVYARWQGDSINNLSSVAYTISNFNGVDIVNVDQQDEEYGCDWALLGRYEFDVGTSGYVKLSVDDTVVGSTVSADAVRFGEIVTLSMRIKGNHIENTRPNTGYQRYVPAIGFDDVDFVNSTISSGLVVEDNLIDSGNYSLVSKR